MKVSLVHPYNLPQVWHLVKPLIDKPLEYNRGEILSTDLLEGLMNDETVLLVGHDEDDLQGVIVAEFIVHPQKKEIFVLSWAVKDWKGFDKWVDLFEEALVGLALDNGCHYIGAYTRKGLAKKLIKHGGWEDTHSIITKHITPGGKN